MTIQRPTIEKITVELFIKNFNRGYFPNQRLGQAFYNQFNLHKLSDQEALAGLWQADGEDAKKLIHELFTVE